MWPWPSPARERPFSSVYRPWHGWCDFRTGSLGGWGQQFPVTQKTT